MLSRGDVVSAGATILVSGVTYFVGGRTWALVCVAVGATILLVVHFLRAEDSTATSASAPVTHVTVAPAITQNANPVITQQVADPYLTKGLGPTAASQPGVSSNLEPRPKLEVIGRAGVMPVGYDLFGVWKVGIGEAQGAILGICNSTAKVGERVGPAHDLAANLEFKSPDGNMVSLVSRAHWLGEEGNQISLRSGETATILLAVIKDGALLTYENSCDQLRSSTQDGGFPRTYPNTEATSSHSNEIYNGQSNRL
jgi:hypothetical protein